MSKTDWLREAGYGVGFHWTSQTVPAEGQKLLSYADAVEAFDVSAFAAQLHDAGAGYVLFTISHAQQYFAFPSVVLDSVLPGRTCRRDLYAELYSALAPYGIRLLFYYPSLGDSSDEEWLAACRYNSDPAGFARLQYEIVTEIGERYGAKLSGWWIDNCYDAAPYFGWGAGRGVRYDYARYKEALCAGNPDRLVAFNLHGTDAWESSTSIGIADYGAGESNHLDRVPSGPNSGEGGALWHGFVWMDDFWVHNELGIPAPRFSDAHVIAYLRYVQAQGGVFTYNAAPYQSGLISNPTMSQLRAIKAALRE